MLPSALPDVVVFNGGSSSGKTSLTRELQPLLPGHWLRFGVDTLVEACPPQLLGSGGLDIGADGSVDVGQAFSEVERCWMAGIAAMARAGAHVLVEDAFLSGPAAQERWRAALHGLVVVWVGVRLSAAVAAEREARRGDRPRGMAAAQASRVHDGIAYDVEIDTSTGSPRECAELLARRLGAMG